MFQSIILSLLWACSGEQPATTDAPNTPNAAVEAKEAPKADAHGDHAGHGGQTGANSGAHIGAIPEGAKVFFVEPLDGAQVTAPVSVKMGVEGMTVQPAGGVVDGTGHHHIIIDATSVEMGKVVPADDQYKHFGKGQTETSLELPVGQHTLELQFANGAHMSYGPQMSTKITITVVDGSAPPAEAPAQ